MHYIIAILITLGLLAAFLVVVSIEERSGKRMLAGPRYNLDARVARVAFIVKHVDWGAFSAEIARTSFDRALHDTAHATLIAVRALERFLTRVVRSLRARQDTPVLAPRTTPPPVERAVAYLRKTVRRTRKQSVQELPSGE